ncbi:hypothetical protein [Halogeometricum limi]|uniref:Uncharacterized protein n=1 Tax=Halogeometricum limi TaxID=555875 RepID=A0A1I6H6R9_9EURY|nr:hypothetical protein [Halogeometricum limi]SFR50193.1 hypothetical protein SAMN04488124_1857 [Halogeometricum limi]
MHESPASTHGYLRVVFVFWVYVALSGVVALGARSLGFSLGASFVVFLVAALLLAKPFLPLFRRYLPTAPHERETADSRQ